MDLSNWRGRGRPPNIMNGKDEIEAANIAKRKRVGQQDAPSMKCVSWKQTENDVSIVLEASTKLLAGDLEPELTDSEVKVTLKDGTRWQCTFNQEIEPEATNVSLHGSKVTIKVKKKQPNLWPSLEVGGKERKSGKLEHFSSSNGDRKESSKDTEKDGVHKLTHVKYDWFEKGSDDVIVHIYVKQINKDSLTVRFEDRKLTATFSTSDPRFLSMHEGTSDSTIFRWSIDLVDSLRIEKCRHRLSNSFIEVHLAKKTARRWCALEASQHKGPSGARPSSGSASSSASGSCWVTASKNLTNSKTKGITTTDQSKVMFEEMCNSPPSGTTANAAATVPGPGLGGTTSSTTSIPAVGTTTPTITATTTTNSSGGASTSSGSSAVSGGVSAAMGEPKPEARPRKGSSTGSDGTPATDKTNKLSKVRLTSKSNKSSDTNKEPSSQKPTCMVSPLNKTLSERPQLVTLGMTGLDNLGNTCFQNSVLQILANTRELRDYFLESRFQRDINADNPLGMGGKLAVAFALLLKVLWSGKHHSYAPVKLKNLIAMKNSLFTGFAQHDAQEFMAFLLDGLHEDLNRIRDKPYTTTVESDGRPDEVVAEEAWSVHKQRNNSFIVDLFQGQYRSKLVCPVCQKVSITFDPFMIVPVPLPKKQRLLSVIFFSKDAFRKPVKYVLRLPKDGTVENLKEAISVKTGINARDLRVFESYKHGVHTFFGKGSSLANVTATDKIYVCEVLSEKVAGEPVVELVVLQRVLVPLQVASRCSFCRRQCGADQKLRRCTRCYKTAYCDHSCQKKDWSRHRPMCRSIPAPVGEPFIVSLPESQTTYSRIVQTVEAYARHSVDVFQPPVSDDCSAPGSPSDQASPGGLTKPTSPESDLDTTPTKSVCSSLSSGSVTEVETSEVSSVTSELDSGIDSAAVSGSSTSLSAAKMPSPEKEADTTEGQYPVERGNVVPVRYVLGRQQNPGFTRPPFYLHPVDKDGRSLAAQGPEGQRLEDRGEEPLDVSSVFYLGMDWRNNDRAQPYVLVQSKDTDYIEDSSVQTTTLEESNMTSLDECLSLFTEPEVLSPEHAWYCPSCKEHREATKQLSIWRLPDTLIIQLKRFSFRNLLWRDKIDKLVDFPTRGLDMSKFYIGGGSEADPAPIYDLYGVINHHGGILGGHYTAYGRCPDLNNWRANEVGWRLFDDSMVSTTSEKQVVTRSAYVLFYRRREARTPLPQPLPSAREDAPPAHTRTSKGDLRAAPPSVPESGFRLASGDGPLSLDNRTAYRQTSSSTSALIDMDAVD